ncbi:hypothetical protein P9X88_21970, partial [Bacillus thuringiensis]|nr:hypothetical protein [Bacillus thuringiensis]
MKMYIFIQALMYIFKLAFIDGYNQAYFHHSPQMLIDAIKKEQKKRHTRKRHPKKSWEKLKSFSLEKVGEQMRDQ